MNLRIRELRMRLGMTQQEVAGRLNIERTSYARYESGSREPDIATLVALADLFQVSLDYLCGRTETPYYAHPLSDGGVALSTQKEEPPAPESEGLACAATAQINKDDLPRDRKELEEFVLDLLRKNQKSS